MEAYKAAFKDLIEKITRHAESIEEHNMILKKALYDLLNEDDVKELPAYTLLKMTYSPYLTDVSVASASTSALGQSKAKTSSSSTSTLGSGSGSVFTDPLHAPPSARRLGGSTKPLAKVEVNPRRPIVGIPLEHQTQTHTHTHVDADTDTNHYSDQMPNMDFCLLGAAPAKSKVKVKVKVKEEDYTTTTKPDTIKLVPKEGETVYKVEIQGKHYLRYNDNLYNIETKHREGAISDFKLGQASPAVELETIADYPGYYVSDGTDNVYILVNGEIAQAVGTYTDSELALWS
jgi:hypothetical protein